MRIWSWLTLLSCATSCAGCPPKSQVVGSGSGAVPGPVSGQCANYQFLQPAPPVASLACPRKVCGLNGTWLGAGVPFRTLHLHGAANPEGIALLEVSDRDGHPMTLDLTGDVLTARPADGSPVTGPCLSRAEDAGTYRPGVCVTGAALTGALLLLGPAGGKPAYQLRINSVSFADFWAQCPRCGTPVKQAPHYHFSATSLADSCEIAVCDPALEHRPGVSILGTSVIFRGDYYDDASYQVSDAPAPDRANADGDLFNIACEGTAIYKLYMLRHSAASASSTAAITTPAQRTAMLKLFTADYCGHGQPFTVNGVPIQIGLDPASSYQVTAASGYQRTAGSEVEAQWTPTGAACLGTPRLSSRMSLADLMRRITAVCSPASCDPPPAGSYATSANPPH